METKKEILNKFWSMERSGILSSNENVKGEITHKMLLILNDWIFIVNRKFKTKIQAFDLCTELIMIIVKTIDIHKDDLQKYGIVCHMLALKFIDSAIVDYDDYVSISDNKYLKEELIDTETEVLKLLNYNIYLPTVTSFISLYLDRYFNKVYFTSSMTKDKYGTSSESPFMESINLYFVVISLVKEKFNFFPSIIATACIYLAEKNLDYMGWYGDYNKNVESLIEDSSYTREEILYVAYIIDKHNQAVLNRYKKDELNFQFYDIIYKDIKEKL